jgi:hypothetical protein
MKPRALWTASLFLATVATSCSVGSAREFDVREDLTGLDLHYLSEHGEARSDQNDATIEGELSGWPLWFAPVVTVRYAGSNTLHHGDAEATEERAEATVSGYRHKHGAALGLGAVFYSDRVAFWDLDGDLERWEASRGVGWGLVFEHCESGGTIGRATRRSAKFLCGLLGYTGDERESTLHLLWLPIPIW